MIVDIKKGKNSQEWLIEIDTDDWGETARTILSGVEEDMGRTISAVVAFRADEARTPDDVLAILNEAIERIQSRLDDGLPVVHIVEEDQTYADAMKTLHDLSTIAFWYQSSGLESLRRGNVATAVKAFQRGAWLRGTVEAHVAHIACSLDAPPSGPAHALSMRKDQILKGDWEKHCRAVKDLGVGVSNLDDLLSIDGYDPDITKIQPATLRKWARSEGFKFRPGRPSKTV